MGVIIALRGAAKLALVTLIVIVVGGLGTWLIAPANYRHLRCQRGRLRLRHLPVHARPVRSFAMEILTGAVVSVIWGGALISSVVPHTGGVLAGARLRCGRRGRGAWLLAGRRQPDRHGAAGGNGNPQRASSRRTTRWIALWLSSLKRPMRSSRAIQPTGRKHLGNYIGAITQYVAGQDRGEAIYCIVDLQPYRRLRPRTGYASRL